MSKLFDERACSTNCESAKDEQKDAFNSENNEFNGRNHEEVNTKEVAQQITAELKRYSIPQAIFAQRVLCRSQVRNFCLPLF